MAKPIIGVFSSQEERKIGAGATARKTVQRTLWFCEELGDGSFHVQPINANNVPFGPKRVVARDDFMNYFTPEPEMYYTVISSLPRDAGAATVRGGSTQRREGTQPRDAAPNVNENALRDNFSLGMTYLERGDRARAAELFTRLLKVEARFEPKHKHLLNELGIILRKKNLHDQAVAYYARALELSTEDENLFFNLARACYGQGDVEAAINCLYRALELNSELDPAVRFLFWLYKTNQVPETRRTEVTAFLKTLTDKLTLEEPLAPELYFDDELLGDPEYLSMGQQTPGR